MAKRPSQVYGADKRDVIVRGVQEAGYRIVGFRPPVPGELAVASDAADYMNNLAWWLLHISFPYPPDSPRLIIEEVSHAGV